MTYPSKKKSLVDWRVVYKVNPREQLYAPCEAGYVESQIEQEVGAIEIFQDDEMAQEEEDQDQDSEPPQEEDTNQGEMKMIKKRKMNKEFKIKDHRTQESTKQFKEITMSTPYLVTFTRG
jgi:hypothetical protein